MKRLFAAATACALVLSTPALAFAQSTDAGAGRALILGTPRGAAQALQQAGLKVTFDSSLRSAQLRQGLSALYRQGGDGPLVIVLNGSFAHGGGETWLLGAEAADQATAPDLATVGAVGVNLDTVLAIAATRPGQALVVLGDTNSSPDLGDGLKVGLGDLRVPQGVTVLWGPADRVSAFVSGPLSQPGRSLAELVKDGQSLRADGYVSGVAPFLRAAPQQSAQTPPSGAADDAAWQVAIQAGTIPALQAYLNSFPQGAHSQAARSEIAKIRAEPDRAARQAEQALNLSTRQRRQIQRNLSLLGHDPHGIDGVFGPGTRAAIKDWQLHEGGARATGYLTAQQIATLNDQAEARQKQLQAQAEQRKQAQDAKDRAYWDQTGAKGDRAGLQSYLDRYPDGLYADVAQARLDKLDAARTGAVAQQDRAAWNAAQERDTVRAYRRYLRAFPQGAFADRARERIHRLTSDAGSSQAEQAARADEQNLALTGFTRTLVEKRLAGLGFDPGAVDGQFTAQTRRAIRRFQRASGLPPTGYLNQQTLVRLVAGVPN